MEARTERARFFARYYPDLQGLKKVPVGLMFLVLAAGNAGLWPWFEVWQPISGALVIAAGFVLYWSIGRYYGRAFGRLRRGTTTGRYGRVVAATGAAVLVLMVVDAALLPPVSMTGLAIAAWMVAWWREGGQALAHYALAGILLAIASFAPLVGLVTPANFFDVVVPALFGLIVLVGGFLDHRTLARGMPRVADSG